MAEITPLYLDTSAAFKLILSEEKGSSELITFLESKKPYSLLSSSLLRLEIQSIIRRLSKDQSFHDDIDFLEYLASILLKQIIVKPISDNVLTEAITILKNSNISSRLRSLDAIHFSTFLSYVNTLPKTILISSDASLIQLADEYKLNVFNPEVEV
ncbi:MAG: PIN domain-containing protein [Leptospiraceae bacterium]|nr:PIN domain-containing protein [Leptospiraceae bacterium]